MAWETPYLAKETTSNTGARAPGGPHYVLLGASDQDHLTFGSVCSDGQTFGCIVRSPGPSTKYEIFEATYIAATNSIRPDVVRKSSNGGSAVVWTGGTQTIYPIVLENPLRNITDPAAALGIQVPNAQYSLVARAIAMAGGSELLSWSNANGVAGAPTLSELFQTLRRNSGGSDAQYTLAGKLILNLAFQQFLQSAHELRGSGGAGDVAMKLTRVGTQDYTAQIGRGGALSNILTNADQLVAVFAATSTEVSVLDTLRDQLTVTVPVPATGGPFHHISVDLMVHGTVTTNGAAPGPYSGEVLVTLQQDGVAVDANRLRNDNAPIQTDTLGVSGGIPVFYDLAAPVAGTSYVFRPVVALSATANASASLALPTNGKHRIRAALYTRSN